MRSPRYTTSVSELPVIGSLNRTRLGSELPSKNTDDWGSISLWVSLILAVRKLFDVYFTDFIQPRQLMTLNIMIDANVLLGFWKIHEGRVTSDLLPALLDLAPNILITEQIRDEVTRNRTRAFLERTTFNTMNFPALPNHLMGDPTAAAWNEKHAAATKAAEDLAGDWQRLIASLASNIAQGSDPVSKQLASFFAGSQEASLPQLERARLRKEFGNPPGKRSDPLGDQVSWEQFLDALSGSSGTAWLISRDADYFDRANSRELLLNPFLRSEVPGGIEMRVFDDLAKALKDIKKTIPEAIKAVTEERLDQITAELKVPEYVDVFPLPEHCPKCKSVGSFRDRIPSPSTFGGWSYYSFCRVCGYKLDTGEPYDD